MAYIKNIEGLLVGDILGSFILHLHINMNRFGYIDIILMLAILILSYVLGQYSNNNEKIIYQNVIKRDTVLTRDTIILKSEPIILSKIKPKLIYIRDTIIKTKPFKFAIDTIIKRDTIYADYKFPDNIFNLAIKQKPDSNFIKNIKITKTVANKNAEWWKTPAYVIVGILAGTVIAKTFK